MSLRQLVDGDCGGVNPLMQLGGQFTRDAARKDEGFAPAQFERSLRPDEQMVTDFLGQVAGPPQSFRMDTLLQEMRGIENATLIPTFHQAPRVIDEVTAAGSEQWLKEYDMRVQGAHISQPQLIDMKPQQQQMTYVNEFFDDTHAPQSMAGAVGGVSMPFMPRAPMSAIMPYMSQGQQFQAPQETASTDRFFEEAARETNEMRQTEIDDLVSSYMASKEENSQATHNYNEEFWKKLNDEWQKLSEDVEFPWLSEQSETYDPYKEYVFAEENPMSELENAFEKGKEYLAKGDIPSAVLCFEVAAKNEPENAEIWELLGLSQAENEMDPQSIAALKRALEIRPDNPRVLMALAISYTNESLQSQALKMLINWMEINPKYRHLVEQHSNLKADNPIMASSLIGSSKLLEVQELFLDAVRMNPLNVDAEVQEALGVLYNLSSEFDKAADCFRAALQLNPQNAKVWNRLGASLANGVRSVEAVEAYQRALELEPGFIRVRYNVGVCCMNLKAYKQAVEHFLTALNMQANTAAQRELPQESARALGKGQQQMSESIWITLKMVISLMGRNDLHAFASDRNLEGLNEAFKQSEDGHEENFSS